MKKNLNVSGGNQRDLARAKNQKKLADMKRGVRTDNLTVEQRKMRYIKIGCLIFCVTGQLNIKSRSIN